MFLLAKSTRFRLNKLVVLAAIPFSFCLGEDSLQKAHLLYSRIAGVKPSYSSADLLNMRNLIDQNKLSDAANVALTSSDFYNVALFQYFASLSNRAEAADVPLNDFIAMGIANTFVDPTTGKDRPYTELLKGDFRVRFNGADLSLINNAVLQSEFNKRTLLTPANLTIATPQRPNFPDAAGVLTSRQFMAEHAIAGTNRRLVHFAFREFLCTDIKEWRDGDPALSDDLVSRDVDRAPGGGAAGARQYQTECRTCHQLQDGMRNAFAYHDFDTKTGPIYLPNTVAAKINKNILFAGGFAVTNDSWENRATRNANTQRFGWRGNLSGNGAKKFGEMIASSFRFSTCTVERVFKQVCRREMLASEQGVKEDMARAFESDDYSLRGLFRAVALNSRCFGMGE
jgi:hypothetical protein